MSEPTIDLNTSLWMVDGFNYRALGRFRYMRISTLRELLELNEEDLMDVNSMGPGTLKNIKDTLADEGLSLAPPY